MLNLFYKLLILICTKFGTQIYIITLNIAEESVEDGSVWSYPEEKSPLKKCRKVTGTIGNKRRNLQQYGLKVRFY